MQTAPELRKYRAFIALLIISAALVALLGRLFYVQLVGARSLTAHKIDLVAGSVLQRESGIILDSGRGDFTDRNGVPLTGKTLNVLIAFPVSREDRGDSRQIEQLAAILKVSPDEWKAFADHIDSPQIWSSHGQTAPASGKPHSGSDTPIGLTDKQVREIEALALPQVKVASYKLRYDDDQIARHVIGFIGQNPEQITRRYVDQFHKGELQLTSKIGGAGLERTLEPWLQGIGTTSISLFTDAAGHPLDGLNTRIVSPENGFYPLKAVTTLDANIQRKIEEVMDRQHIREGAVVVLDAASGDVAAMASRPQYDPRHIDLPGGSWANRAVKATIPGSIFKTVVAAAALEEKVAKPGDTFDCGGALGKYGFTCWKKEGHGHITLREAFAQSCNIAFGLLMERLTGEQLERTAKKLGIGSKVGWSGAWMGQDDFHQWDAEDAGQLFAVGTSKNDEGTLMQTAIGQRDVRVTPLQAANLVVSLLNKGEVKSPRVVQNLLFQNGRMLEKFAPHTLIPAKRGVSAKTANELLAWMNDVVDHGTGKPLGQAKWRIAGKSGTAQVTTGTAPADNQWFIGYGPVEKPRYAVSVVVENVSSGEKNRSLPLFKEVMDVLAALRE
ncbi:peptidoglycan D,D-transpeptidase FtsI family protein [Paenibacillus hamazuiensis]|uniref:peptidoglycan D,D-transpeptidase FtsI family protein n=1 Tax=Paenibacillus hamazuiensis TaxID=2936508 RepID=UPI00200D5715|nr:penicillin-binding protein 2 [Paenibacillus hamazuiensis]